MTNDDTTVTRTDWVPAADLAAARDEVEQLRTRVADRNASLDRVTAERDEAREQRDLNSDLLDGAAKALGIDLTDPDVHYIYEIPTKVAELVAALTKSREYAAGRDNEIGRLVAENARVRQQRDEALAGGLICGCGIAPDGAPGSIEGCSPQCMQPVPAEAVAS
ncbi:hypothetical protein OG992_18810 [Micromonospora sp. NBC_00362]|uniref:hypothetical protein n=1 Tax=Micromonospora sp. NBC_00362 TaxID=2975975 RepID=UPI002252E0B9|nr:hypothetical protein [Micromonospora sp. NBC_00362]MCX5119241.1 hypothetical protein [Micromonospora sp. NBC_00362]